MERRSGRGRQAAQEVRKSVTTSTPPTTNNVTRRGGARSEPRPAQQQQQQPAPTTPVLIPASEVPTVGSEEVVLNRRGMPARQRKRNRLYYDDDMITSENWKAAIARNAKKVKSEPVDPDEESQESDDDGPPIIMTTTSMPDMPDLLDSPPKPSGRGRASQSPSKASPTKFAANKIIKTEPISPTKSASPVKSNKKVSGRGAAAADPVVKNSPQRGGRQPTLQLNTASPERRGGRNANKSPLQKEYPPDIKPDAEELELALSNTIPTTDRWGKLVQRANKLSKEREARAAAAAEKAKAAQGGKRTGKGQRESDRFGAEILLDGYDRRSPKKEPLDRSPTQQEKEREKLLKEKEKKQAILKEKEQERAKERLLKEKEKKGIQKEKEKEKKREHRDSISVLPPMVKLSSRSTYLTTDDQHLHQSQQIPPQQFMAVIKIDDTTAQVIDKRIAHDISIRLRNLLKLPKAHKWVCYEWFYSNIDKVLFEGENDFQICLKESFPTLKARKLTRTEWTKIRRLMGKPRRCSQAFFDEEREELSRRRAKIRQIQQRKVTDFSYKELPDEIPLQLVIGTKVTARLRRPQDGLFTGTIEGVDTSNNTYRITFDRPGLGTHSIPDYEVLSNDAPETVSTSSFALKIPRRSGGFTVGTFKFQNPALLGDQPEGFPKSPFPADGMLGGFPIRLLDMIVRLSKLLKAKREKIMTLKELNVEAEKMKSYGRPYNAEYRARYARCVLDLDSMNKQMAMYLEGIQTYCLEITNDHGSTTQMVIPEHILDSSRQEASMVVSTYNCKANRTLVHNQKIVGIVHQLTSLMLQVRALSTSDRNLYELKSLKDTIRDVKASLEGKNLQCFQNKIEIPMNRIIAGLCVSQPKAY